MIDYFFTQAVVKEFKNCVWLKKKKIKIFLFSAQVLGTTAKQPKSSDGTSCKLYQHWPSTRSLSSSKKLDKAKSKIQVYSKKQKRVPSTYQKNVKNVRRKVNAAQILMAEM